jgi:hypothetical protein
VKRKFGGNSSGGKFGKGFKGNKKFSQSGSKARKVDPVEDDKEPTCYKCGIKGGP